MTPRPDAELALLRQRWPDLRHDPDGQWVLLPGYPLPEGWSHTVVNVAFQIPVGPPGSPPYAFYADAPLTFLGSVPNNFVSAGTVVPFPGKWGQFSWSPDAWPWAEDPAQGANMCDFAKSFAARFAEGQ